MFISLKVESQGQFFCWFASYNIKPTGYLLPWHISGRQLWFHCNVHVYQKSKISRILIEHQIRRIITADWCFSCELQWNHICRIFSRSSVGATDIHSTLYHMSQTYRKSIKTICLCGCHQYMINILCYMYGEVVFSWSWWQRHTLFLYMLSSTHIPHIAWVKHLLGFRCCTCISPRHIHVKVLICYTNKTKVTVGLR